MKNTLETRLGVFFALALIAALLILELIGGADFFKGGYRVNALFNNIQDLKEGAAVKMAGVPIGRVETIDLADGKVKVTMKINRGKTIHTDSKAVIKFTGLLSENFVAIDFGTATAPKLEADQTIMTAEQPDLSSLMAKLEGVADGIQGMTKNFSGDSFQNLLGPFTDFLKENNPRITAILGNVQNISGQIAEGKGTIGKLISDQALYNSALATVTNLESTSTDIRGLITQARGAVDQATNMIAQINAGQGTLGKLMHDEQLYSETTTAMTNLKEILQKVNRGEGSVGKLVNDDSLIRNAKLTLQKLDEATEGLEDQGPLSVLGMAIGKLF